MINLYFVTIFEENNPFNDRMDFTVMAINKDKAEKAIEEFIVKENKEKISKKFWKKYNIQSHKTMKIEHEERILDSIFIDSRQYVD